MADYTLRARFGADLSEFNRGVQQFRSGIASASAATMTFGRSSSSASFLAMDLGRALNDSQQFAYGFRQGLVAVSNQVDGLIHGFSLLRQEALETNTSLRQNILRSLTGTGGLLIGLNLGVTLLAVFGTRLKEAIEAGTQTAPWQAVQREIEATTSALHRYTDAMKNTERATGDGTSATEALSVAMATAQEMTREWLQPLADLGQMFGNLATRVNNFVDAARAIGTLDLGLIGRLMFGIGGKGSQQIGSKGEAGTTVVGQWSGRSTLLGGGGGAGGSRGRAVREEEVDARAAAVAIKELADAMAKGTNVASQFTAHLKGGNDAIKGLGTSSGETAAPVGDLLEALAGQKGADQGGGVKGAAKDWSDLAGTWDNIAQGSLLDMADGFSRLFVDGKGDAKDFGQAVVRAMGEITRSIAIAIGRMVIFRLLLAAVGGPGGVKGGGVFTSTIGGLAGSGAGSFSQTGPAALVGGNIVIPVAVATGAVRRGLQMERAAGLAGSL